MFYLYVMYIYITVLIIHSKPFRMERGEGWGAVSRKALCVRPHGAHTRIALCGWTHEWVPDKSLPPPPLDDIHSKQKYLND
jgi:hypothetical protein